MARHLAPFSCRQTIAEIVRRRSWGGVLPLGRHVSISGSRSIHAPSVSIALSSFQEGQNARHHNQFKIEQALELLPHIESDVGKEQSPENAAFECECATIRSLAIALGDDS